MQAVEIVFHIAKNPSWLIHWLVRSESTQGEWLFEIINKLNMSDQKLKTNFM